MYFEIVIFEENKNNFKTYFKRNPVKLILEWASEFVCQ
jgi:hypothetical protein